MAYGFNVPRATGEAQFSPLTFSGIDRPADPETFNFLGFTHFCTTSRKRDAFVIGRSTIRKRMRARLQFIKQELCRRMHDSIYETGKWLRRVLQVYLNYFAVSGDLRSLYVFFTQVR